MSVCFIGKYVRVSQFYQNDNYQDLNRIKQKCYDGIFMKYWYYFDKVNILMAT